MYYLTEHQINRIRPYFSACRGVCRQDDRRIISGIIHVLKRGLQWRDAPAEYGPHKTLYNRFIRWSEKGIFQKIFSELVAMEDIPDQLQIDATHIKAHRTAASLAKKRDQPRAIGRTKGGLNSKLHAVTDGDGRPVILVLTAGNVSDYKGADMVLDRLPSSRVLLGDKGYDSARFREALKKRGIEPCIPPRKNRNIQFGYDKKIYKQRHKIENMFGWIKDWRRIGTRYDRCAHTFMSAVLIAAIVMFYLNPK